MAKNRVVKSYSESGNWLCPAGNTQVKVTASKSGRWQRQSSDANFSMFLEARGNLYGVGQNQSGGLGNGAVATVSSPVATLGALTFIEIDVAAGSGGGSSFGLTTQGTLYAWGGNSFGDLGLGDLVPRSSPIAVIGGLVFQRVKSNGGSSGFAVYALTTSGKLYSWGTNTQGGLGVGDLVPRSSPTAVLGGLVFKNFVTNDNPTGLSTHSPATYALTTGGALYAWGVNSNGGLGVGDVISRSSPVAVLGSHVFKKIYTPAISQAITSPFGCAPAYAIDSNDALWAWGSNQAGNLGVGDVVPRSSPVAVLGGLTFSSIATTAVTGLSTDNLFSVVGLNKAGKAYAWGSNAGGQLGDGTTIAKSSPVAVLGNLVFQKVFGNLDPNGAAAFFGLTSAGALYAWGSNSGGMLGVGDVVPRSSPVAVLGSHIFKDVSGNVGGQIFATAVDGTIYAWGLNPNGQLGLGDQVARSSPVAILGGFTGRVQESTYEKWLTVTPGTTYAIGLDTFQATFGAEAVGNGPVDTLTLEYFE